MSVEKLDGKIIGPSSFSGNIEMEMKKSEKRTIDKNFIVLSQKVMKLNAMIKVLIKNFY